MTQASLAELIGTHRSRVALIASELRRKGLIDYRRGNVVIVDRRGLMETACECYSKSLAALKELRISTVVATEKSR